ncbi:hypothetical protein [Carboxylicivirga sp. RSCT41]|uniref:hypothetical protein n=1 Tax=Carboxylicivirga agarovorans TaxID=3417570 RepID=UPI003D3445A0
MKVNMSDMNLIDSMIKELEMIKEVDKEREGVKVLKRIRKLDKDARMSNKDRASKFKRRLKAVSESMASDPAPERWQALPHCRPYKMMGGKRYKRISTLRKIA